MQMVKKILITLFLIWLFVLLFMPRIELYYLLEKTLAKQEVKMNETKIEEHPFSLEIQKATVYYKGIPVATIEKIDMMTLLFYTEVKIEGLKIDELFKDKVPYRTDHMLLTHSILDPVHLHIKAEGSFGELKGEYDLRTGRLHIDFMQTKEIGMIEQWLKKGEKGYYYETSF